MYTTCKMKETTSNCYMYKTTKDKSELKRRESESEKGDRNSYGDKKWPRDFVISPENYRHTSRVPYCPGVKDTATHGRLPEHHRTPLASWTLPTSLTVWLATESTQKAKSAESRPRYLERGAFLTLRWCWNKIK